MSTKTDWDRLSTYSTPQRLVWCPDCKCECIHTGYENLWSCSRCDHLIEPVEGQRVTVTLTIRELLLWIFQIFVIGFVITVSFLRLPEVGWFIFNGIFVGINLFFVVQQIRNLWRVRHINQRIQSLGAKDLVSVELILALVKRTINLKLPQEDVLQKLSPLNRFLFFLIVNSDSANIVRQDDVARIHLSHPATLQKYQNFPAFDDVEVKIASSTILSGR